MNVLYVLSSTVFGGATLSFLTLLKGLISFGVCPIVAIPNKDQKLEAALDEMHVKYYVVPVVFCSYPYVNNWKGRIKYPLLLVKMLLVNLTAIWKLKKLVKQERIDLVHTNVGPIQAGHWTAKLCKVPHVWHIREYGDLDFNIWSFPSKRYFQKKLASDYSICITHDLRKYNHLEENNKSYVVYNGVREKSVFDSQLIREPFFLCASRLSPEKGIDLVISTFAKFSKDICCYKLVILGAGDPEYVSKLQKMVADLHLEDSVVFEGFRHDVFEYMKRAKALLVASPAEGFGRMTAEACFAGCLVVGRNSAGTKEILDQTGGLFFNNAYELLAQMKCAAQMNPEEYLNLTKKAHAVANDRFSEESYIQNVWNVYRNARIG